MCPVGGVGRVPRPADKLGHEGDAEPDETDDPAAVQVRPQRHEERKELKRAAAAAEVPLEPVQLEAGEGKRDHLCARTPDWSSGNGPERETHADHHKRLPAHLPVHEVEAGVRDQAEEDADPDGARRRVDEPHEDLREVLVVGPDVVRNRVREDVGRRQAAVLHHPPSDADVPPEVRILNRPHKQCGDDDQHAAQEQRAGAQAIGQSRQVRARSGLGA